jgi:hypothetical protein
MSSQPLVKRVESLEERVTLLEQLPARVDGLALQIVQLREEMHAEFSAIRTESQAGFSAIRTESGETRRSLREEIRTGDEETRRQMRLLYEDVIARLVLIQEGPPRRPKARGKTR